MPAATRRLLAERDDAERGGRERLGEDERRGLAARQRPQAAGEEDVRERGRDRAEIQGEAGPPALVRNPGPAIARTGTSSTAAPPNPAAITPSGAFPAAMRRLLRTVHVAYPRPAMIASAIPAGSTVAAAVAGEQDDARGGAHRRERPAAGEPLAVDDPPERAGGGGPGPDRHDRPDRDAREVHGGEEAELVDADADRDAGDGRAPPRERDAEPAGDQDEERAADDDPRRADGDGRRRRPDGLRRAGRAEADGGEEDLEAGGHSCNC